MTEAAIRIGFVGLSHVGAKLAGSLLRNGFDFTVRDLDLDLDPEAEDMLVGQGAVRAESGRALAEASEVVITCLPSPQVLVRVLEEPGGVLEGRGPGKIWLEMSTTEAADVQRLGALVEARGAVPLDTPVSGGCHRATTGNIAIFVSGERAAFERALPLLTAMGRRIVHTGPLGSVFGAEGDYQLPGRGSADRHGRSLHGGQEGRHRPGPSPMRRSGCRRAIPLSTRPRGR